MPGSTSAISSWCTTPTGRRWSGRHGVRILQVDPWNRLESARGPGERDDEYILRCLRTLYQFATDINCHVQVLAHPAKMDGARRNSAPVLEDIAGAKHWDNVVDQGFTVHRPKLYEKGAVKTETAFYHRKARFDELGHPCRLSLDYKLKEGKYVSVDYEV
jgi:twinkle protein